MIRINVNTAAKGRKLQASEPVYVAFEEGLDDERQALQVECRIGEVLFGRAGLGRSAIDTLIVAASLPRIHRALLGGTLARILNVGAGRLMEFSGGCGSVIDAIHYAFGCGQCTERIVIMVLDSFATSYAASSAGRHWVDGGGLIEFSPEGPLALTLEAYVTAFDPMYLESAHPVGGAVENPFKPAAVSGFRDADRYAIRSVIERAVLEAKIGVSDIAAVVMINRSTESLEWLSVWLGAQCYFAHSRESLSHAGGADIMANLQDALGKVGQGYVCLLGTGLGYTWHAMLLKVSR